MSGIYMRICAEVTTFPVILTSNGVEEDAAPNRWNFKKAHLLSFQAE